MALTVEELQIVLSCDATTAQTVLKQMSATVKAYTDKFQKYFNTSVGKVAPLDSVAKQIDQTAKRVEAGAKRIKKAYKDMSASAYVPSGDKFVGKGGGMGDPNYFRNSQAEFQKAIDKIADNNQLIGLGAKVRGMMEEATGSIASMPDVLKYKVQQTAQTIRKLSSEYAKSIAQSGENSKGSLSIKKKLEAAVVEADKLLQKMRKIAAEQNAEPVQEAVTPPPEAPSRWERISASISAARKRAHTFGVAVKKAFNHTLLGRFLNRLRMVTMRMAAMALIRGVINGTKQGLQELAKVSESSAKAMNTIKAAGGSIKMALGAALMPIVKALAPVFVSLAGAISSAANALARFFAVVTGQSTYTAVSFGGALDGIASSAGGAGKAVHGMLAEFDELIVIGNKAGGGGGGGSGVEQSLSTVGDLPAVSALATRIRESILSGDWTGVGEALNDCLAAVNKKFSEWLDSIKKMELGKKAAQIIAGFFAPDENGEYSTFEKAGENVGKALGIIITDITDFFENFPYADVWNSLVAFVNGLAGELERAFNEKFGNKPYWEVLLNPGSGNSSGGDQSTQQPIDPGQLVIDSQATVAQYAQSRREITKWLQEHIGAPIAEWFQEHNIMDWVDEKIAEADEWLGSLFGDPIEGVKRIWEDTKVSFEEGFSSFVTGWEAIGNDISNIGTIISSSLGIAGEYVGAFFTTLIDFIAARGEIISGNVQRFILNIKASVLEGLAGLVDNLANGPMGRLLSLIGVDLAGAAETLRGKAADARDAIGEIDDKIADAQDRASNGFDISANVNASKVDALKTKIDNAKSAIGGTSSKVGELNGKLDELNGKNVNTTVTVKVNTKGGTSSSSGSVTVSRPSVNITLDHLAVGGIAYGPAAALIGEYAGAAHNPEVVAPLSDLVGILAKVGAPQGGTSEEEMRLLREQNSLLRQIAQKELKLSPSTQLGQVVERSRQLYART